MRVIPVIWLRSMLFLAPATLAACGGSESSTTGSTTGSTSSNSGGTGGTGAAGGGSGGDGNILVGSGGAPTTTTTLTGDPCDGVACELGQHCVGADGTGACVNNTCDELMCGPTELCEVQANGGAICKDISCANDLSCPAAQFCDGTICVDDLCVPGTAQCMGDEVLVCAPNGSGDEVKLTCGGDAYFASVCAGDGMGTATCSCEDDWDCPAFTACDAGACAGTGKAPTCSLPPVVFQEPGKEFQWGSPGTADTNAKDAEMVGVPFPLASQVMMTPLVANLDDDNGDGLINERDFPEIIFMSFCSNDFGANGVVRAIHGGGAKKGKDYFAMSGPTVWHEGDNPAVAYTCAQATALSTGVPAVGDLDGDGVPEIVVPTETNQLMILDNTGNLITTSSGNFWTYGAPTVAIANLDHQGFAEVVVGRHVFTMAHDANGKLVFQDHFAGALKNGTQGTGPTTCVANIAGDALMEIVAATTAYRMPTPPNGVTKIAECPAGAADNFCTGKLDVVWNAQTVNGVAMIPDAQSEGFCAVADVLGGDEAAAPGLANPLDGKAEVVLVSNGYLTILNGETGTRRRFINLGAGTDGGAPNVDDFDGDGFPEIGSAFGTRYLMLDLQDTTAACPAWPEVLADGVAGNNPARTPGAGCMADADCAAGAVCNQIQSQCVCLHNGWQRKTEDDSSRVTSSSVFDFNGDGAAEVVYNDECYFRIYDGTTAAVLSKQPSPSRTRIENPAIADVDNDGNAEIVFPSNNFSGSCSTGFNFPSGIAVWGDPQDSWVSARRIWNEHAYHVTNVTEGGQIPLEEPEHWKSYKGRSYNTFRSNPRNYNVAPDLTVSGVQVSSPDVACGELSSLLTITATIDNAGDLRIGPGVQVTFYGIWGATTEPLYADAAKTPLTAAIQSSLEPGDSILLSVTYDAAFNDAGVLPDQVKVIVDEADVERECHEDNNAVTKMVEPSMALADLRLVLGTAFEDGCPMPQVKTTVINDGAAAASNVVVRYYAGDPNVGGTFLHQQVVAGAIAPNGGMTTFNATIPIFPDNLSILIYGIVDPDNAIPECNDGNNKDAADNKIECGNVN